MKFLKTFVFIFLLLGMAFFVSACVVEGPGNGGNEQGNQGTQENGNKPNEKDPSSRKKGINGYLDASVEEDEFNEIVNIEKIAQLYFNDESIQGVEWALNNTDAIKMVLAMFDLSFVNDIAYEEIDVNIYDVLEEASNESFKFEGKISANESFEIEVFSNGYIYCNVDGLGEADFTFVSLEKIDYQKIKDIIDMVYTIYKQQ